MDKIVEDKCISNLAGHYISVMIIFSGYHLYHVNIKNEWPISLKLKCPVGCVENSTLPGKMFLLEFYFCLGIWEHAVHTS